MATSVVDRPIGQIKVADPKAIWDPSEVPSDDDDDDAFDTRTRPVYIFVACVRLT